MNKEKMDVDEDARRPEGNDCGHTMYEIYRGGSEWDLKHFPEVKSSANHTVLYHLPIRDTSIPPIPYRGQNKWDANHVRLPCAQQNQYVVKADDNTEELRERWSLIRTALAKDIRSSHDLETSILSYNTKYSKTWRFQGLHKMFQDLEEAECEHFFSTLLPGIIRLALALPDLVPAAIPLLKRGMNKSISFTQQQIASLLANAFLCTFPRRNAQGKRSEYRSFPDINFNRLFQSSEPNVIEKLRCICNYFRRVTQSIPTGVVTFMRRCMHDKQRIRWDKWEGDFASTKLHVTSDGTIEDDGCGLLQVDFANKYLGGGVLGYGCVQEEIRFVICPEMIVSKLVTEVLDKNEALFMIGCERYSQYHGYASTFEFDGSFDDLTPYDESRRRICNVVAIDALNFYAASDQYKEELIRRELDKAYVGYYHELNTPAPGIATGNWGCGAFGGNKRLKALIQLMVCCVTCRPMVYFTFCDKILRDELIEMHTFLVAERITVAELWSSLVQIRNHNITPEQIYSFIYQWHRDIKHAHLLYDSSPNLDYNAVQSTTAITTTTANTPSSSTDSSSKFQWPSKKNQSIPPSAFYNKSHCDTTSKLEKFSAVQSPVEADLYADTIFLDPAERDFYRPQLANNKSQQTVSGGSSLLSALDEDYGVRSVGETVVEEKEANLSTSQKNVQHDGNLENTFGDDADHCERKVERVDEIVEMEPSNADSEEVIPCTPPTEKSLKRKAGLNKKQKKITDIFSAKVNP